MPRTNVKLARFSSTFCRKKGKRGQKIKPEKHASGKDFVATAIQEKAHGIYKYTSKKPNCQTIHFTPLLINSISPCVVKELESRQATPGSEMHGVPASDTSASTCPACMRRTNPCSQGPSLHWGRIARLQFISRPLFDDCSVPGEIQPLHIIIHAPWVESIHLS